MQLSLDCGGDMVMAKEDVAINVKESTLITSQACQEGISALAKLVSVAPHPVLDAAMWWPRTKGAIVPSTDNATRPGRFEVATGGVEVYDLIGEGSRSQVFSAVLERDRLGVVVKRLRSGLRHASAAKMAVLKQDFELIADQLRHPNVVQCQGVSLDQSSITLVFEFMGGRTLEDYYTDINEDDMGSSNTVPFSQTLSWSRQLFEGLRFLHERPTPIVLRDLKPSNLLLSADSQTLKIRNFGLDNATDLAIRACSSEANFASEARVDVGQLARPTSKWYSGTARYMAPEIESSGSRLSSYTASADIYSAGLVMFLMLEGRRPWEEFHGQRAHSQARAEFRPKLEHARHPEGAVELLEYCWAHEPEERPAASQVLYCLTVLNDLHCQPHPAPAPVTAVAPVVDALPVLVPVGDVPG